MSKPRTVTNECADAASEAAGVIATELCRRPVGRDRTAHSIQIHRLANLRDDIEACPEAFIKSLFDLIDRECVDSAYDRRNDPDLFRVATAISRVHFNQFTTKTQG